MIKENNEMLVEAITAFIGSALLTALLIVLFACCGCGESREINYDLAVKVYHFQGENTLSAYDTLRAFDICSMRWRDLFEESLTLAGFEEVSEVIDRSGATDAENDWQQCKHETSNAPENIARLCVFPASKISDNSEQIYSGGLASYWDQVAVIFVGPKVTKNRVGVDRAAALICHELQHLRGLTDEQIRD